MAFAGLLTLNSCSKNDDDGPGSQDGTIVYAAVWEESGSGNAMIRLMKNGVAVELTGAGSSAGAMSVFVHKDDVYVAGHQESSNGVEIAKYWKNGVSVDLTNGGSNANSSSIFVVDE